MASAHEALIMPFYGFQSESDKDLVNYKANVWITAMQKACLDDYKVSKPQTFDALSNALLGEAQYWYQKSFTSDEKNLDRKT